MAKSHSLTFFEHLDEFRKRLVFSLLALAFSAVFSYIYSDQILEILSRPIRSQVNEIYFFSPAEAFVLKVKVALLSGLCLASPVILSQIWLFISPALHPKERRFIFPLIFITSFLFLFGVFFAFAGVLPVTLQFLVGMQTAFLKPMVSLSEYLGFLSGLMLAFGFAFNFPVFVLALVASGAVSVKSLNHYHRHVLLLIFIASAVLTPSPDIASQLLLAIPLVFLFEMSLLAGVGVEALKRKKMNEAHS